MNIGELSQLSGISAKMIRHYEKTGMVNSASRQGNGYREYETRDVEAMRFIRRARDLGFSTERLRALVKLWQDGTRPSREVKAIALAHIAEIDLDIARLQSLRDDLKAVSDACKGDQHATCAILETLSGSANR